MIGKTFYITFLVNFIVGMLFNAMNMLAYRFSDLYFSITLVYVGCIMAANMVWSHEVIHWFTMGMFDVKTFIFGILLTLFFVGLARYQVGVDKTQWMRRMIPHHSTALTTTNRLLSNNPNLDPQTKKLAEEIISTQEREISQMKSAI